MLFSAQVSGLPYPLPFLDTLVLPASQTSSSVLYSSRQEAVLKTFYPDQPVPAGGEAKRRGHTRGQRQRQL